MKQFRKSEHASTLALQVKTKPSKKVKLLKKVGLFPKFLDEISRGTVMESFKLFYEIAQGTEASFIGNFRNIGISL